MAYMNASPSDEQLAARIQRKDESAFTLLIDRYEDRLLRYGQRFLSQTDIVGDVVQDIFVAVWENIQSFDTTKPFSPWMYRIAHNAFVDVLRKKAKEPIPIVDFDRIIPHPVYVDPSIAEKEKEEMRVLLMQDLTKLTSAYREVIDLYYFEHFSYKEIADILHVPLGTVGIRLSRAREALKKEMSKSMNHRHE